LTAVSISLIWTWQQIFPLYFSHSSFLVNKCGENLENKMLVVIQKVLVIY